MRSRGGMRGSSGRVTESCRFMPFALLTWVLPVSTVYVMLPVSTTSRDASHVLSSPRQVATEQGEFQMYPHTHGNHYRPSLFAALVLALAVLTPLQAPAASDGPPRIVACEPIVVEDF